MKRVFLLWIVAGGMLPWAQDSPERVTVPFSDPSRPKMVKVSLLNGGITVKGYNGKEVIVESRSRDGDSGRRHPDRDVPPGMHRIYGGGAGLQVEESENTVTIGTERINNSADITVQVPVDTSLKLATVNGGNIVVDSVNGDVDVNNTNGAVTLNHISGSAIAHALNGKVIVTLDKVTPNKAMSFSSLNGNVDVTLPSDIKCNVRMKTDNGEIYSDFDVKLDSGQQPIVEDNRNNRGRYRVRFDHGMTGSINGGGPEIQFTTFNGNIYIRKAK